MSQTATQNPFVSHSSRVDYGRPLVNSDRFGLRPHPIKTTYAAPLPAIQPFRNVPLLGSRPMPGLRPMPDVAQATTRWLEGDSLLLSPKTRASMALLDNTTNHTKPHDQVRSLSPPWNETKQDVKSRFRPFDDDWDPKPTGSQPLYRSGSSPLENHTAQNPHVAVAPMCNHLSLAIARAHDLASGRIPPSGLGGFEPRPQLESSDPDNATIFVGNLEEECVTESTLRQVFEAFGPVRNVKIPLNKKCGFVAYQERSSAERALDRMQGFILHSLPLRLNWGHSNKEKSSKEQDASDSRVLGKSADDIALAYLKANPATLRQMLQLSADAGMRTAVTLLQNFPSPPRTPEEHSSPDWWSLENLPSSEAATTPGVSSTPSFETPPYGCFFDADGSSFDADLSCFNNDSNVATGSTPESTGSFENPSGLMRKTSEPLSHEQCFAPFEMGGIGHGCCHDAKVAASNTAYTAWYTAQTSTNKLGLQMDGLKLGQDDLRNPVKHTLNPNARSFSFTPAP